MKLKKIASLMLAGIMAVSMLAACGEGKGEDNGAGSSSSQPTSTGISATVLNLTDKAKVRKDVVAEDNTKLNNAVAAMAKVSARVYEDDIKKANAITTFGNAGDLNLMIAEGNKVMAGAYKGDWASLKADGTMKEDVRTAYDFYYVRKGLGDDVINELIADTVDVAVSHCGAPNPGEGDTYEYTVSVAKADWLVGTEADATKDGVIVGIAVTLEYNKVEF